MKLADLTKVKSVEQLKALCLKKDNTDVEVVYMLGGGCCHASAKLQHWAQGVPMDDSDYDYLEPGQEITVQWEVFWYSSDVYEGFKDDAALMGTHIGEALEKGCLYIQ